MGHPSHHGNGTAEWFTHTSDYINLGLIVLFLAWSGICSGLLLGIMSLDQVGLKIVINTGSKAQAKLAAAVLPLRENGNLVLISLILSETVVNMAIPLLIESYPLGEIAAIASSALLVLVFAEIIPISACARNALYVGAKLSWLVHAVKFILFPIGYPMAKLIDLVLGEELPTIYNRSELKGLLDIHAFSGTAGMAGAGLGEKEVQIMKGALELGETSVTHVMTHIQQALLLPTDAVLDQDTMNQILIQRSLDRVAVVDRASGDLVCFLLTKNLYFHRNQTVSQILDDGKAAKPCLFIPAETKLVDCLHEFERSHVHIAFVYSIDNTTQARNTPTDLSSKPAHSSSSTRRTEGDNTNTNDDDDDMHPKQELAPRPPSQRIQIDIGGNSAANNDHAPDVPHDHSQHIHPEFGHIRVSLHKAIQSRVEARNHQQDTSHMFSSADAGSGPRVCVIGIVTLSDIMSWLLKTSAYAEKQAATVSMSSAPQD